MKHAFKTLVGAAAVASMTIAAGTAQADTAKCQAAIGKNISKYQATLAKTYVGCHKLRTAGKGNLANDCNDSTSADTKLKLGGARAKAVSGITAACLSPGDDAVKNLYVACPSPNAGPTSTFEEIANCLLDTSESYMEKIADEVLGNPATVPASAAVITCQGAIAKAWSKYVKTVAGAKAKCQAGEVKLGNGLVYDSTCIAGDASGKIAPALGALTAAASASCGSLTPTEWRALGTCNADLETPTVSGNDGYNAQCITKIAVPTQNGLASAIFKMPGASACTPFADITINAAFGDKLTNTRLDSGYTGLAHNVDVVDDSLGGVKLENCNDSCENCEVKIDPTNGYCRCSNDILTECTNVNAADPLCGGNTCHCMFGPPLALSSGGTPVCVVNRFAEEFDGLTGEVGEYSVETRTRALVYTGISQTKPCPTCVGDTTPNDGNRDGNCSGGARNTLACDTNAEHPDFGPSSFDCQPLGGANISGAGLNLGLEFTSGTASFTAAINNASFCEEGTCHCSHCSADSSVACATVADCTAAGLGGTCGVNLDPDNPAETSCTGGSAECLADGSTGMGLCDDGPFDLFCSGAVRQNGGGIIPCVNDASCDAYDTICQGGDCGTCTIPGQRSCFLDTVSATGTPGIFDSEGVSVFCSAATNNSGVNSAGGLPGPGRVKLDFDFDLKCSDHTTQFQLPLGANCP